MKYFLLISLFLFNSCGSIGLTNNTKQGIRTHKEPQVCLDASSITSEDGDITIVNVYRTKSKLRSGLDSEQSGNKAINATVVELAVSKYITGILGAGAESVTTLLTAASSKYMAGSELSLEEELGLAITPNAVNKNVSPAKAAVLAALTTYFNKTATPNKSATDLYNTLQENQ